MTFALSPGTVLSELLALRPVEQSQVLGLLLERCRGEGGGADWVERLAVESGRLGLDMIPAPSDEVLEELSRERWQAPLKDCFLRAVVLHEVRPTAGGAMPSVFRAEAARHGEAADVIGRLAGLRRDLPRLVDRLASYYLAALSETLGLDARRRLKGWLDGVPNDVRRLRGEVLHLGPDVPQAWRMSWNASLKMIEVAFEGFDVVALRKEPGARKAFRSNLWLAAASLGAGLAELIRLKTEDAGFPGSDLEKRLQRTLGYWDWDLPDHWIS